MLFGIPTKLFLCLIFFFTLLPVIVLSINIKSSYLKVGRRKKLFIILLAPIVATCVIILLVNTVTHFLYPSSLTSPANFCIFLGKLLLVIFLMFTSLYLFIYISKLIWKRKHPDYAVIMIKKKNHLTRGERILFLSIDKEALGKSSNAFQSWRQILITSGEHEVEFSKITQRPLRRLQIPTEDFREELLFYFKKNAAYHVTVEECGRRKKFNITQIF